MLAAIIRLSVKNKFIVLLFTLAIVAFGTYSLSNIKLGAVPDITNNQVQIITTSQNLSTQDIEQFVTYPIELEMANLPGVMEIRSVSKFGLSVVTVVFEDDMGTYLPRQLIAEKIKAAAEQIPEGFGKPEMGPITTGLGEIYQYTIEVEDEFAGRYSAAELRTIQDWIVKRQLSGIEGVVEINTWGGFLKQYEVAIDPARLNAMNISVNKVFEALQKNNQVAGGAYIEKTNKTYFIRAEGKVTSLEDIQNIVVVKKDQTPIFIKDVAHVGYGHANRFGAITANGKGEKVMGQVMMLKGASSNDVINRVKERVKEVQKTLPEGVYINPFLERSELIGRTTFTIAENLIIGCLIVILVVVLLLGNLRSGLVVASVIPLSLLFALSMMYLFDIDANLMSLGAIDFGIIIDGAVIIVEFTAFQLNKIHEKFKLSSKAERKKLKDETTVSSAGKMMNSAIFGQMIILLVFIPILSLQGVEGKMFKPMAMTFAFALIGEMILCFTYVPVVSSLWLKAKDENKRNISDKIIDNLNKLYEPTIQWAVRFKRIVLIIAFALMALAVFTFSRMGGEFVPTLDEGDFVIQPVLKTGTSLSETVDMMTKLEKTILDNFPEVEQAVSRIGAAEVPTDPMSMEQTDLIITLKDKDEWVSAESKDELAVKIKEKLEPFGVGVEFTQPIEMRFNELITGVRSDIAIKVFGEDLKLLSQKANEIKALVEDVEGAADVMVEKTEGLPQMLVNYKRDKIARYGLNIADVNDLISLAYAGKVAGVVFEGEKRFDLVLRMTEEKRKSIEDLQNLYVDLPTGGKVPLRELADVKYDEGAAMISRDDTRRRIVVRVNVRDRDLQSVVDDMRSIIDQKLDLPVGYSVSYGGQFENLSSAKKRLLYAVPIALVLIFIMLYFAFGSVKEALLIYSAIPLATVGGVFMLEARGMPFSISAGIGFIALFGIAVLNGIVLIDHFKELQKSTKMKIDQLVVQGGKDRMRAVLLTATSTAFGFLPMAFSTNAGAEVQRPLATVVIGGMISATLLTLIVLPVLYSIFVKRKARKSKVKVHTVILLLIFSSIATTVNAQEKYSLEELKEMAYKNNGLLKSSQLQVDRSKANIRTAFEIDKTELYYAYDENDLAVNGSPNYKFGVQQNFSFPLLYTSQRKLNKATYEKQKKFYELRQVQIDQMLQTAYFNLLFEINKLKLLNELDSIYSALSAAAEKRYKLGETNYLEKVNTASKVQRNRLLVKQSIEDKEAAKEQLKAIVQTESDFYVEEESLELLEIKLESLHSSSVADLYESQLKERELEIKVQKNALLPDLSLEYFQGTNEGLDEQLIGYQFGLRIPLFFGSQQAKIKSSQLQMQSIEAEAKNYDFQLQAKYKSLMNQMKKHKAAIDYYQTQGKKLSNEIRKAASQSFKSGSIDYLELIMSLDNAIQIELEYLENVNKYNQTVIQINNLTL